MNWSVHCADVLTWCEDYAAKIERGEESPFHCILTDPSYGLGNNPDIEALLTAWMSGEDYDTGPGFMQRDWDVLPSPRYWRALRRICHPGAYLFAFGGTRTADLLSVALRLAGWERFDEIDVLGGSLSWVQGAGFPKSLNLGKKIDSAAGIEREVIGRRTDVNHGGGVGTFDDDAYIWKSEMNVTIPATPLAAAWQGHGSAMKPAHEPILAFRNPLAKVPSDRIHAVTGWDWWHSEKALKDTPHTRLKMLKKYGCRLPPLYGDSDLVLITRKALHEGVETDKLFVARARQQWRTAPTEPVTLARVDVKAYRRWSSKTYAANCLSTGAGGLWIDGSRVTAGEDHKQNCNRSEVESHWRLNSSPRHSVEAHQSGRWPPNVCLSHVPPRPDGNGGWLPGCERLGVKRVKPGTWGATQNTQCGSGGTMGNGWAQRPTIDPGVTDPDGLEPVTAYACVLACDACGHQWTAEQRGACPECEGVSRWACAVAELGEQSGERPNSARPNSVGKYYENNAQIYGKYNGKENNSMHNDTGSCTRFYPQFTWQHEIAERLAGVVPFRYVSKAGRAQRDAGLEGFKEQHIRRHSGGEFAHNSGSTNSSKNGAHTRNPHPTVKNIELTKWLATLLLPPPEYAPRRLLNVFGGSGSESIGAGLAGWDEVVMVEMSEEYCDIARARLRFWADWAARGYDDPAAILKAAKREETRREEAQMELL